MVETKADPVEVIAIMLHHFEAAPHAAETGYPLVWDWPDLHKEAKALHIEHATLIRDRLSAAGWVVVPKVEDDLSLGGEIADIIAPSIGSEEEAALCAEAILPLIAAREVALQAEIDRLNANDRTQAEHWRFSADIERADGNRLRGEISNLSWDLVQAGQRIKVLETELKRVEWCLDGDCPICFAGVEKHRPGCELAAAIGAKPRDPRQEADALEERSNG